MAAARRLLLIGAHPDDCEWMAGGLAARCARAGWRVHFVSVTDGGAGHMEMTPAALVARRAVEARRAAARIGATCESLGEPDGRLFVTPRSTDRVIACIRRFRPDVLVTHRTCDYHRDHRYTAQLVLDASFVLMVPLVVPRVPPLAVRPVILYACDHFTEGPVFRPDLLLDTTAAQAIRTRMLLDHVSQFTEWIPWVDGNKAVSRHRPVTDAAALGRGFARHGQAVARRFAKALRAKYRRTVASAEAFQISEYGHPVSPRELAALIPG